MSLLHARGLSVRYGPKVLLDGASFALGHHDRAGLIGPNGSGKSTLLKILAGQIEPDGGAVQLVRKARAGYLPQELSELPPGSVLDGVLASVPGRSWLQARLAAAEAALAQAATEEEQVELGGELAELHEQLAHHEELYGRHRAEEILGGLGFGVSELDRPASELSGGWRMRAALAALLLQDPELLLLDEPTNHLDVPTLEWFDSFLRRSRKALLLVSHDREFLDRQIDRVLSLEPEGLRAYAGNYERYLELRAAEEERLAAQAEKQSRRRAQMQAFIERFRAKATKARQVQSRVRLLEKEEIVQVREERATVRFRFPEAPRSGREVARLERVSKSYGATSVFRDLSAQVLRGDRAQRRRQDDAAQAAGGRDRARRGRGSARAQRGHRVFRAASHRAPGRGADHPRGGPRAGPHATAELGPRRARFLPLLRRRGGQAHRRPLRRRARPGRARAAAGRPFQLPPHGRAHQPPGPRLVRGADRRAHQVRGDAAVRLPQPQLRERAGHPDLGGARRRHRRAAWRSRRLVAPPGRADGRRGPGRIFPAGSPGRAGQARARAPARAARQGPGPDQARRGRVGAAHRPAGAGEEGGGSAARRSGALLRSGPQHAADHRLPRRLAQARGALRAVGAQERGARRGRIASPLRGVAVRSHRGAGARTRASHRRRHRTGRKFRRARRAPILS